MSERVPAALRRLVQQRAGGQCEYCLLAEDDAMLPHEPDHIIACKHRGPTDESNLAWSCFVCNSHKGSDIASIDIETGQVVRLYNPRIDSWSTHFRLEGARLTPLTPVGRVTEYLLQFNQPDYIELRQLLIQAGRYPPSPRSES
jgi:hypothetical protein